MDDDRFDAAVRSLVAGPSRRAFVGRAAVALLAGTGVAVPAAKGSARKKRCRGCPVCKECVRGRCRPLPDTTPCGGSCTWCQGGRCVNKPNDSSCPEGTTGKCLNGVCNSQPNCIGFNVSGCAVLGADRCCSDECIGTSPNDICTKGEVGKECIDDGDCLSGSCVGYVCQ